MEQFEPKLGEEIRDELLLRRGTETTVRSVSIQTSKCYSLLSGSRR